MRIWVDAQLSPAVAPWITETISGVDAISVKRLGLRDADDEEIFQAARNDNAVVLTKDRDFQEILLRRGSPPKVILVTCGNTSNPFLKTVLKSRLPQALELLKQGESIIEIG